MRRAKESQRREKDAMSRGTAPRERARLYAILPPRHENVDAVATTYRSADAQ